MKLVTVHTTNRKGKGSDAQERTLQHTHTTPAPTQRFARAGTGESILNEYLILGIRATKAPVLTGVGAFVVRLERRTSRSRSVC